MTEQEFKKEYLQSPEPDVEVVVTPRHVEILEHMLGNKGHYRNYFASHEDGVDYKTLLEMVELGLVTKGIESEGGLYGPLIFFHATDKGKKHAFKKQA